VLAFITHGGAGSVSESIRYATPMICIPLFGDQPRNAKLAEHRNVAVVLDKHNITVESVTGAIREILSNNKYALIADEN
jgi:glucuronosyltransferase